MTSSPSLRLAGFAAALTFDDLPAEVAREAKLHLLDALGCGLAAHGLEVAPHRAAAVAARELFGAGRSSVLGSGERLSASGAAFVNATLCHAMDFDDTHYGAMTNVTAVLGPAALALAERLGSPGRDVITALVAGTEATTRIGAAAMPAFGASGFHPAAVCGAFGATVAAGNLLELGHAEMAQAIGLAGGLAAGTYEPVAAGSSAKAVQVGWAAQAGIACATLAAAGAEGPETVFDGPKGVMRAFFGLDADGLSARVDDLGTSWETPHVAFRRYPACTYIHGPLDAATDIVGRGRLEPDSIASVRVGIPEPAVEVVAVPHERKSSPQTPYEARFSLPYSIASLLVHGRVDVRTYTEAGLRQPQVSDLAQRVRHAPHAFPDSAGAFAGHVQIEMTDGTSHVAEALHHRGGGENRLDRAEVIAKFRECARLALGDVGELEQAILSLEQLPDLSSLGELVTAGAR